MLVFSGRALHINTTKQTQTDKHKLVTHNLGDISKVSVYRKEAPLSCTHLPYLHNHEYFALDRVLLVSVGVCSRALDTYTLTHLPDR